MKKNIFIRVWQIITLMALSMAAVGSLILMFNTGRNQKSILLITLFTIWVLSPFMMLLGANLISNRWAATTRAILYGLMLILSIGSLISYGGVFNISGTRPAFMFLMVPFVSWVFMGASLPLLRYLEKREKLK